MSTPFFYAAPHCLPFSVALNNTYSEDFDDAVIVLIFTDANRTFVATNAFSIIIAAIIDIIMISSTADWDVVAPIISQMLLLGYFCQPAQKYPPRSTATITKVLNVSVAANKTAVVIYLNPASVFVDPANFAVTNFTDTSISDPVGHINVTTTPGVLVLLYMLLLLR